MQHNKLPFIFGAQYYRAPTPEPECWEADLRRMQELGFNSVKYWAQWRGSHRRDGGYSFDGLDRLMDLAEKNQLQVTINTIFDVAPHWLYEKYPDARQIMANGHVVEPYTVAHRQIGGHPGPCYNHPDARQERKVFLEATVRHLCAHPALSMWDAWNEPELCFPQRSPDVEKMVCYCSHCRAGFLAWLKRKYVVLDQLNQVWGRYYETWEEVELPRNPHTITDYVDWREFHIATMTGEASWRLDLIHRLDPAHVAYLHVVPNTMSVFNSVACATDDFELAQECDVFAATMNGGAVFAPQVLSAGQGKVCYNVESHVNFGMTNMHQRVLGLNDLLKDWLPQVGLGIRGFLFWQFRPEVLGFESPAWGVVNLDGSDRPVTLAVVEFIKRMAPLTPTLMRCAPPVPQVGIWKSRKNEVFHFSIHNDLTPLVQSVEAYNQALYWRSLPFRNISGEMLADGDLADLKLLILPSPYYLTQAEADALDAWVRRGGVALCEAHMAGYNGTTGRHSRILPGAGLAECWGLQETLSTSSYHLKLEEAEDFDGAATSDVKKALASSDTSGGLYYPLTLADGTAAWGAYRYAELGGEHLEAEGWCKIGKPVMGHVGVGQGNVYYAGTNLGQAAQKDATALEWLLARALESAKVEAPFALRAENAGQLHIDLIAEGTTPRYLVVNNHSNSSQRLYIQDCPTGRGLFSGIRWHLENAWVDVPGDFIDLIEFDL